MKAARILPSIVSRFSKFRFLKKWFFGFSPCKSDFRKNEIFLHENRIEMKAARILPSIVSRFSKFRFLKKVKIPKMRFPKSAF